MLYQLCEARKELRGGYLYDVFELPEYFSEHNASTEKPEQELGPQAADRAQSAMCWVDCFRESFLQLVSTAPPR